MTTPDTAVQLKPCPFCRGPAEMRYQRLVGCWSDDCPVNPNVSGDTPEQAAEAWNTRAVIPKQQLDTVNADSLECATAGPWRREGPDEFGDHNILHPADSLAVAAVVANLRPADEVEANARLLAASWDMAELLRAEFADLEKRHASKDAGARNRIGEIVHAHDKELLAGMKRRLDRIRAALALTHGDT